MKIRTVWAVPIFAALLVLLALALWLSYFGSPPAPPKAHIAGEDLCAAAAEEAGWAYDLRFRVRYFAVPQSREAALSAAQEFFSALFSAPQA